MSTLYERIGGPNAVSAAVEHFYDKVLADERIRHFFQGVDLQRQIGKQKAFLTMAFGGPVRYTGADMRSAHRGLVERGLNDTHFDAVLENLVMTLGELGVAADLIGEAAAIAESVREDVLGRSVPALDVEAS